MLLKEALLNILVKLADDFDRANLEDSAEIVDNMIQNINNNSPESPEIIEIEVDEDERMEIQEILEKALQSMKGE